MFTLLRRLPNLSPRELDGWGLKKSGTEQGLSVRDEIIPSYSQRTLRMVKEKFCRVWIS